jgi:hypothetical protein
MQSLLWGLTAEGVSMQANAQSENSHQTFRPAKRPL